MTMKRCTPNPNAIRQQRDYYRAPIAEEYKHPRVDFTHDNIEAPDVTGRHIDTSIPFAAVEGEDI